MRRARTVATLGALLVVVALVRLSSAGAAVGAIDAAPYLTPQRLVDIGGRRLNIVCLGRRANPLSPAVLFDSGVSDWSFAWATVQPAVGKMTIACAYDRAGMGFSDPSPRAGTSAHAVDDLHRLLTAAHIAPPYVLVGHSLGGVDTLLFAYRFPRAVAGLVEIDPATPDLFARSAAATHGAFAKFWRAAVGNLRACAKNVGSGYDVHAKSFARCIDPPHPQLGAAIWAMQLRVERTPAYQREQASDYENIATTSDSNEGRPPNRLGAIPLVVLTHAAPTTAKSAGPIPAAAWEESGKAFAALSTHGVDQTIPNTTHYIQLDRPDVVIKAIASVLAASEHRAP